MESKTSQLSYQLRDEANLVIVTVIMRP